MHITGFRKKHVGSTSGMHSRIHWCCHSHYHLNVVDASQDIDPNLLLLVYNTISTTHSSFTLYKVFF
uniref:Uncharacterized protein n=1 Tax=Moniliophthora roreri TaxID=221103 RepID=A0A0W0GEJ0_MONRR